MPNPGAVTFSSNLDNNDLFAFNLFYNTPSGIGATSQKNGNISQTIWQTRGRQKQTYGYSYDFLNRLTATTYGEYLNGSSTPTSNSRFNTSHSYDVRGNITALTRNGLYNDGSCWQQGQIDNLGYNYPSESNRLESIADSAPSLSKDNGFKPGVGGDYGYDENGNMNYDPHKEMNIRYNYLNLPECIEFADCKAIEYNYDATGVKLKKTLKNGNAVISTQDYVGGIEYKNGVVEDIYHSEGRLSL